MINKKYKSGFSLAQLMIALFVTSVILAATSPMIVKAHKKIPSRAPHGKYICYWSNGNLIEEYYNSKTRVSQTNLGPNGTCKFESPSKVASYYIELIGGGAGGNYYYNITETTEDKSTTYDLKTGLSDSNAVVYEPTNEILKAGFNGEVLTFSAPTGNGTKGQDIKYHGNFVRGARCGKLHENGAITNYISDFTNWVKDNYDDKLLYSAIDDNKLTEECNEYKSQEIAGVVYDEVNWLKTLTTVKVPGQAGASNAYLNYSHKINIPTKESDVASYLKKLVSGFVPGKCKYSDCSDFTASTIGTKSKSYKTKELDFESINEDISIADSGIGQDYYAAIKKYDGTYKVASEKAQGGHGAVVDMRGTTALENVVNGVELSTDAPSVPGTTSTSQAHIPTMGINTKINVRNYQYGIGGGNGEYAAFQYAQLKGCTPNPGKGGKAGTAYSNLGKQGETTTLVCKDPLINLSAGFGINDSYAYADSKKENLFSRVKKYEDLHVDLIKQGEKVSISPPDGNKSGFDVKKNIFTFFKKFPDTHFGSGGSGTGLVDNLLDAWGEIKFDVDGVIFKTDKKAKVYSIYDIKEYATITEPTDGESGAVIISW